MPPRKGHAFFLTITHPWTRDRIDHMHRIHCVCEVTKVAKGQVSYKVLNVRSQEDTPPVNIEGGRKPLPQTGGMTVAEWRRLGLG